MKRILIQSLFVVHAACFCLAPSSNLPFCRTPLRYRSTSGSVCVGMNLEKAQEAASVYTRNSPETNVLTIAEAALSARLLAAGALLSLIPAVAWGFVDVQDLSATPLAKKSATIIVEGFPRVVDGDTLVIEDEKGGKERIRLLGIDAPESKQTCKHKDGTEYMCGIESQQVRGVS